MCDRICPNPYTKEAQSGLGPGPGWGPYGPIGPLWAHMGPILLKKSLIRNNEIIHKNIKVAKLEILKVETWFGDKDV